MKTNKALLITSVLSVLIAITLIYSNCSERNKSQSEKTQTLSYKFYQFKELNFDNLQQANYQFLGHSINESKNKLNFPTCQELPRRIHPLFLEKKENSKFRLILSFIPKGEFLIPRTCQILLNESHQKLYPVGSDNEIGVIQIDNNGLNLIVQRDFKFYSPLNNFTFVESNYKQFEDYIRPNRLLMECPILNDFSTVLALQWEKDRGALYMPHNGQPCYINITKGEVSYQFEGQQKSFVLNQNGNILQFIETAENDRNTPKSITAYSHHQWRRNFQEYSTQYMDGNFFDPETYLGYSLKINVTGANYSIKEICQRKEIAKISLKGSGHNHPVSTLERFTTQNNTIKLADQFISCSSPDQLFQISGFLDSTTYTASWGQSPSEHLFKTNIDWNFHEPTHADYPISFPEVSTIALYPQISVEQSNSHLVVINVRFTDINGKPFNNLNIFEQMKVEVHSFTPTTELFGLHSRIIDKSSQHLSLKYKLPANYQWNHSKVDSIGIQYKLAGNLFHFNFRKINNTPVKKVTIKANYQWNKTIEELGPQYIPSEFDFDIEKSFQGYFLSTKVEGTSYTVSDLCLSPLISLEATNHGHPSIPSQMLNTEKLSLTTTPSNIKCSNSNFQVSGHPNSNSYTAHWGIHPSGALFANPTSWIFREPNQAETNFENPSNLTTLAVFPELKVIQTGEKITALKLRFITPNKIPFNFFQDLQALKLLLIDKGFQKDVLTLESMEVLNNEIIFNIPEENQWYSLKVDAIQVQYERSGQNFQFAFQLPTP